MFPIPRLKYFAIIIYIIYISQVTHRACRTTRVRVRVRTLCQSPRPKLSDFKKFGLSDFHGFGDLFRTFDLATEHRFVCAALVSAATGKRNRRSWCKRFLNTLTEFLFCQFHDQNKKTWDCFIVFDGRLFKYYPAFKTKFGNTFISRHFFKFPFKFCNKLVDK